MLRASDEPDTKRIEFSSTIVETCVHISHSAFSSEMSRSGARTLCKDLKHSSTKVSWLRYACITRKVRRKISAVSKQSCGGRCGNTLNLSDPLTADGKMAPARQFQKSKTNDQQISTQHFQLNPETDRSGTKIGDCCQSRLLSV